MPTKTKKAAPGKKRAPSVEKGPTTRWLHDKLTGLSVEFTRMSNRIAGQSIALQDVVKYAGEDRKRNEDLITLRAQALREELASIARAAGHAEAKDYLSEAHSATVYLDSEIDKMKKRFATLDPEFVTKKELLDRLKAIHDGDARIESELEKMNSRFAERINDLDGRILAVAHAAEDGRSALRLVNDVLFRLQKLEAAPYTLVPVPRTESWLTQRLRGFRKWRRRKAMVQIRKYSEAYAGMNSYHMELQVWGDVL